MGFQLKFSTTVFRLGTNVGWGRGKGSLSLLLCVVAFVVMQALSSCSERDTFSNEDIVVASRSIETPLSNGEFTGEQLSVIARLEAINDSISLASENGISIQSSGQQQDVDWGKVTSSDVKGFFDGVKFGWTQGRGLWGRVKNAALFGASFSVVYSLVSLCIQLYAVLIGTVALSNLSPYPSTPSQSYPYTFSQTYNMVAYVWNETELDNEVSRYGKMTNSYVGDATREEFKVALVHNEVIRRLRAGEVAPNASVDNPFTQKELEFMNSSLVAEYFEDVPNIVDGSVNFEETYGDSNHRYSSRIMSLYSNGIQGIASSNSSQFLANVQNLCVQYIGVIHSDNTMDPDMKSVLISSFYVGPLSAEYWTQEYE